MRNLRSISLLILLESEDLCRLAIDLLCLRLDLNMQLLDLRNEFGMHLFHEKDFFLVFLFTLLKLNVGIGYCHSHVHGHLGVFELLVLDSLDLFFEFGYLLLELLHLVAWRLLLGLSELGVLFSFNIGVKVMIIDV